MTDIFNKHLEEIVRMYFNGYSVAEAIQEVMCHASIEVETGQSNNKKQL